MSAREATVRAATLLLVAGLGGCGGRPVVAPPDLAPARDAGLAVDQADPPDLTLPERPATDHPPLLQVHSAGGPVLKALEMWTVAWPGDELLGARVERFHAWMLASDYWKKALTQYGVGAGVSKGLIVLPNPPPDTIDTNAFPGLVAQLTAQPKYAADKNTVFAFVVPRATQVTSQGQDSGCFSYGGYHSETPSRVVFEVNLQCAGAGGWDDFTFTLSHEAAEAATDPHPFTAPGWLSTEVQLGEIGDLCNPQYTVLPSGAAAGDGGAADDQYSVARLWSNQAAASGNSDPCVPAPPGQPWFGVAVDPPLIVLPTDDKGRGQIAIKLLPFAFGDVGAIDWQIRGIIPGVQITPARGHGRAGDTIAGMVVAGTLSQVGAYDFTILATSQKGGMSQWYSSLQVQ